MYCNNCGTKLPDNSKYCNLCGNKMISDDSQIPTNNVVEIEIDGSKKIAIWSIVIYASIFYLLSQFASSIVISIYVVLKQIPLNEFDNIADYLLEYYPNDYYNILSICNLICYIPILTALILISLKILKHDIKKIKGHIGRFFAQFGIGFAILYAAALGTSIIVSILLSIYAIILQASPELTEILGTFDSTTSANQEAINNMLNSGVFPFIGTLFITIIAAPIVEELIFRKSFFALSKKKGIACIIISGIIFGSIHVAESVLVQVLGIVQGLEGHNISNIIVEFINLISYVGSGVAFGIIYKKSNYNIYVTILVHAVYNALGFLLMLI